MLMRNMTCPTLLPSSTRQQSLASLLRFVVVGSAAAAVHWGTVVLLVGHLGWWPLLANGVGWVVAVGVSFTGHHRWSFRHQAAPMQSAAPRFLLVSASGFLLNQLAYAAALRWSGARYDIALAVVLLAVAVLTYLMSRFWAFAQPSDR